MLAARPDRILAEPVCPQRAEQGAEPDDHDGRGGEAEPGGAQRSQLDPLGADHRELGDAAGSEIGGARSIVVVMAGRLTAAGNGCRRGAAMELDRLARDLHECLFERGLLGRELDEGDRLAGGSQPDRRAGRARDLQVRRAAEARVDLGHLPPRATPPAGPPRACGPERCRPMRRATRSSTRPDAIRRPRPTTISSVAVTRHLAHQMRGDEHRAALSGERFQQVADPEDAFGVEPVDRLVQQQRPRDRRAARRRCPGAVPCPARSRPPASGDLFEADQADNLVDPRGAECRWSRPCASRWLRAERPVWIARGLEQRADLAQRRREVGIAPCR